MDTRDANTARGSGGHQQSSPTSKLLDVGEMQYGPGPDVFPPVVQFCFLHGAPDAAGEMFTVRLKASQGCLFAPHSHPHDEHLTIVSGRLLLGDGATADRARSRSLGPGSYAFLPKEQFHYAWAEEEVVFQVNAVGPFGITYANSADDPRAQAAR